MPKRRKVGNLMALAILSVVTHRPMYPYEMAAALRNWGKDSDMKLKWGSFYAVVQSLAKHGLLAEAGTTRQGRRPARTVYRITDEGRAELRDWARELLSVSEPEPQRFRAALSVMAVIPPAEVADLLQQRLAALEQRITARTEALASAGEQVPRLFLIEDEYDLAILRAEAQWVRGLRQELIAQTLPGIAQWQDFHDHGTLPAELTELAEQGIVTDQP